MKRTACLLLLSGIVAGCNPFDSSKKEQLALERQRQEDVRRERDEQERFAKSLTEYANGKQKLVKETIRRLEGELAALRGDIEKFSQVIAASGEEKDAKGNDLSHEVKLLRLLRNPQVNDLAKKYLSADFTLLQHEFIDRVREARADESRYQKALAQSDESFDQAVKDSQKWVNATKEQREAEINRLQREIVQLENRRGNFHQSFQELTKKTMVGNVSKERERREKLVVLERKLGDVEGEIRRKRGQVDFLRTPNVASGDESRAASRKQDALRQANSQRDNELRVIDRYYKPKATVTGIVSETSEKSVKKLQNTMAEKRKGIETELADAKRSEREVKEALLAIPISNMSELKALRAKIEK